MITVTEMMMGMGMVMVMVVVMKLQTNRERVVVAVKRWFYVQVIKGDLKLITLWNVQIPLLMDIIGVRLRIQRRLNLTVHRCLTHTYTHTHTQHTAGRIRPTSALKSL